MKNAFEAYARAAGCDVVFREFAFPVVYAVSALIQIIDRSSFDLEYCNVYVAFSDDVNDDTPCIVVDEAMHLAMPGTIYIVCFDLTQPDNINDILDIVKNVHATVPIKKML